MMTPLMVSWRRAAFSASAAVSLACCLPVVDMAVLDSSIDHGMIIDAGSRGSRLHVYQWEPRIFNTLPPPLSYPISKNKWTDRMEPGLASFSTHPHDIPAALEPLIAFAKEQLKDREKDWSKFPIYLKATGGVRELPYRDRESILSVVREYLGNPETCPFYFTFDQARVISGEEEGIYGWAAVNFLRGDLLNLSQGSGTVDVDANRTVGTLDLGGASTQISFFKTDQDVLANLFKLQIGAAKHWNVYTHSFLYFGLESARLRMLSNLAALANEAARKDTPASSTSTNPYGEANLLSGSIYPVVVDACLPVGFNETFVSLKDGKEYLVVAAANGSEFAACDKQTELLMEKQSASTSWCEFAHHGQCSLIGVYQPELPKGNQVGRFYAFAGYFHLWEFLELPEKTSIASVIEEGKRVCTMTRDQLYEYNKSKRRPAKNIKYLPEYCFMASYATTLLMHAFGFPKEEEITFADKIGGFKVDWALGSMLYEINALPWSYSGDTHAAVACSEAAQATAGNDSGTQPRSDGYRTVIWLSVAAFVIAIAVVWGYLEMSGKNGRRKNLENGGRGRGGGGGGALGECSPWRNGSDATEGRRLSSQYESISDVSPRI